MLKVSETLVELYKIHQQNANEALVLLQSASKDHGDLLQMTRRNIRRSLSDPFAKQLLNSTAGNSGKGESRFESVEPPDSPQRKSGPLVQSRRVIVAKKMWLRLKAQMTRMPDHTSQIRAGLIPSRRIPALNRDLSNLEEILELGRLAFLQQKQARKLLGLISIGGLYLFETQGDKFGAPYVLPHGHILLQQNDRQIDGLRRSFSEICRKEGPNCEWVDEKLITADRVSSLVVWAVVKDEYAAANFFRAVPKNKKRRSCFYHCGLRDLGLEQPQREVTPLEYRYILKTLEHSRVGRDDGIASRVFATVALVETVSRREGRCSTTFGKWNKNGRGSDRLPVRSVICAFRKACKASSSSLVKLLNAWAKADRLKKEKRYCKD